MVKKVVVINGAGIGKYKFLESLKEHMDFNVYSTVSKVKDIAKLLGWDGETLKDKDRLLISNIKDAYSTYNNGPIVDVINNVEESEQELNVVLSREKNDNDKLREHFGKNIKIILFSRVGQKDGYYKNHADQGIYDYKYDRVMLVFKDSIKTNIKEFKEILW